MWYIPYNGMSFRKKICSNMEVKSTSAKLKLDAKGYTLYNSVYTKL